MTWQKRRRKEDCSDNLWNSKCCLKDFSSNVLVPGTGKTIYDSEWTFPVNVPETGKII